MEDIAKELGYVSIPYQRESTWEQTRVSRQTDDEYVSIPYQRESTWELTENVQTEKSEKQFQFPTNGKALVNTLTWHPLWVSHLVSIPYQRESTCEP